MNDLEAERVVNKIMNAVFKKDNSLTLEELKEKYAFDIKLPYPVKDSITSTITWASSPNSKKYITNKNMEIKEVKEGWMLPKKDIHNLNDLLEIWNSINFTTTERVYDSINISKSDTIYNCENLYHCNDCRELKNSIYCDSCGNSEYLLASQRSTSSFFSIRVDDSKDCSNSYNVICSSKIRNSLFIQDCYDLTECIFCSHISSKRYCIANMQFEEEEYFEIKKQIIEWIINS